VEQLPVIPAMGFDLSSTHLIILLIILLLLFGHRLPQIMRGLGGSIREFKKGMNEDEPPKPADPNAALNANLQPPNTTPSAAAGQPSAQPPAGTPPTPPTPPSPPNPN
jgi:sec-independent protein translocase protein TatA